MIWSFKNVKIFKWTYLLPDNINIDAKIFRLHLTTQKSHQKV